MINNYFNPFPTLTTQHFTLRAISIEDAPAIYAMRSNSDIMRYIPIPLAQHLTDAEQLIHNFQTGIANGTSINWGITHTSSSPQAELIGIIGFVRINIPHYRAEIGYIISQKMWNKGVISEVMPVVLRYGFEIMQLHSIVAIIDPNNIASQRVLQKAGFVQEAHFKEDCYFEGRFLDSVHFSLLQNTVIG